MGCWEVFLINITLQRPEAVETIWNINLNGLSIHATQIDHDNSIRLIALILEDLRLQSFTSFQQIIPTIYELIRLEELESTVPEAAIVIINELSPF